MWSSAVFNMSRSYRKTPVIGHGGNSEKQDKRNYNRSFRNLLKISLRKWQFDKLPEREFNGHHGRNWNFRKDGKSYFDRKKHPELMKR